MAGAGTRGSRGATASLVLALGTVLVANGAPTALYATWQQDFGLSDAVVTATYASAAAGVLPVLLVLGGLSDQVGRRPVVLAGLALAAAGTVLLLTPRSVAWLVAGRVLVGFGVGALSGAATAALGDRLGPAGARLAAATTVAGIALGPLLAGLLVEYAPDPRRVVFAVVLVALAAAAVALVLLVPETAGRRGSVVVRPHRIRPPAGFAFIAAAAVTAWSTIGLFQSLGPKVVGTELGITSTAAALALVFAFLGSSAAAQVAARGLEAGVLTRAGLLALPVGGALLLAALATGTWVPFLAGAVVAGSGQGLTHLGAQSATGAAAAPGQEAEAFSALLVAAYLGGSLPPIALGLAAGLVPLAAATTAYVALVSAASLALLARLRYRPVA